MAAAPEIELKLELTSRAMRRLARSSALRSTRASKSEDLVSVYYDTDNFKLRRHGVSLRVRRVGDQHLQTIKNDSGASGAAMDRHEWSVRSQTDYRTSTPRAVRHSLRY